jgi:hypothetical protein
MSDWPEIPEPTDAAIRRSVAPVVTYTVDRLPPVDAAFYAKA